MESTKHICLGIQSMILGVPLMITPDKLQTILDVVGPRIGVSPQITIPLEMLRDPDKYRKDEPSREVQKVDVSDIKTIKIHGTLTYRSVGLRALSGLTSYQRIRSEFFEAMDTDSIHTILLDIDSPGGSVAGVFDLVDDIYKMRGKKPIYAFVNDSGYSAAYAIASAADHVYMTRTAGVGSIGVVMLHTDRSEQDAKAGVKYTPIYAGANKVNGNPHEPLSKAAHAKAQTIVNQVYDLFVSTVARNNGLSEQEVRSTEADIYTGPEAIDRGLIDGILSYNELISMITQSKGGKSTMSNRNATTPIQDPDVKIEETPKETTPVVMKKEESVPNLPDPAPAPAFSQADLDLAIESERLRCSEILEACTIANCLDLAHDMISNNLTADTARKTILTIMAERTQAQSIKSVVNPGKSATSNALLADAKKRAEG